MLPEGQEFAVLLRDLRRDLKRSGVYEDSIDDLIQEALLRTLGRHQVERRSLRRWLRVVVRNLLWEQARADRNRRQREIAIARPESTGTEESDDLTLWRLVAELPPVQRRVIELRYLEGLSPQEIAVRLGRPPNTVRSWLKRALDGLRERMPRDEERRSWLTGLAFSRFLSRRGRAGASHAGWKAVLAGVVLVGSLSLALWFMALEREAPTFLTTRASEDVPALSPTALGLPGAPAGRAVLSARPAAGAGSTRIDLRGTVRDPQGHPVAHAELHVASSLTDESVLGGTTDEQGGYQLGALPDEAFVWATHPDWCPSSRCELASLGSERRFDPVLHPGVRSHVRVEDSRGRRLSDGLVRLGLTPRDETPRLGPTSVEHQPRAVEARLAADGTAWLRLPDGDKLWYDIELPDGRVETGELDGPTAELTLRLAPTVAMHGRTLAASGQTLARVHVQVASKGLIVGDAWSDADGAFRFDDLPAGPCGLLAFFDEPGSSDSCTLALELAAGPELEHELVLSPQHTLSGRVDAPYSLEGARMEALPLVRFPSSLPQRTAPVATDGSFSVPACPPVEHRLRLLFPDGSRVPVPRRDFRPGTGERVITMRERPGRIDALTVEFTPDSAAFPSRVELRSIPLGLSFRMELDAVTHSATFTEVQQGYWFVHAWIPGLGTWRSTAVELQPGDRIVSLRIPSTGRLVVDLSHPPGMGGAEIRPELVEPRFGVVPASSAWFVMRPLESTGSGRFETEIFPGSYQLQLRDGGAFSMRRSADVQIEEGKTTEVTIDLPMLLPIDLLVATERLLGKGESVAFRALGDDGETLLDGLVSPKEGGDVLWIPEGTCTLTFETAGGLAGSLSFEKGRLGSAPRERFEVLLRSR